MGHEGKGAGADGEVVELSVVIEARRATVWRCVTERNLLSQWMQADVRLEARVGAPVAIDFTRYGTVVAGRVDEVVPGERLAFTWGIASGPDAASMPAGSTRVSLVLADAPGGGTLVTLRHTGLPSEKSRRDHGFGWNGYLGSLANVAPLANVEGGIDALWDRWFAAWAELDGARRAALLSSCVEPTSRFCDTHADVTGIDGISAWIAVCQVMFPGVAMARTGGVLHTRGAIICEWEARTPGGVSEAGVAPGTVVARGLNHARLSPHGRLVSVEGFWRA